MSQVVIPTAILGALVVGILVLAHVQRENGRRIAALMARIDELEGRRGEDRGKPVGHESAIEGDPAPDRMVTAPEVSGDVLAGRTSFIRRVVDGETPRPASTAELAIRTVHAQLEEPLQPADLASHLSISLRTLERGLTADLECTPRQLILAMKMREAFRLLETGRYRVNEVAYRLGFSSPSHFSRRFRSFYHRSPTTVGARDGD